MFGGRSSHLSCMSKWTVKPILVGSLLSGDLQSQVYSNRVMLKGFSVSVGHGRGFHQPVAEQPHHRQRRRLLSRNLLPYTRRERGSATLSVCVWVSPAKSRVERAVFLQGLTLVPPSVLTPT